MNTYLLSWNNIRNDVSRQREKITPLILYDILDNWSDDLGRAKDSYALTLYQCQLAFYKGFNILDYSMKHMITNPFDDLVEYSLLRPIVSDLKTAVEITDKVLWGILAFRSNKECPVDPHGYLKVLSDKERSNIYFCCDTCDYCEDANGVEQNKLKNLIPANSIQIDIGSNHTI